MATLSSKIKKFLGTEVDFLNDVKLQNDGGDDYIKEWNLDIARPTDEQLASYETAGNTEEANNIIIATRKSLYGSWDKQLEEINEQGLDAWKERIAQIKADNPKE